MEPTNEGAIENKGFSLQRQHPLYDDISMDDEDDRSFDDANSTDVATNSISVATTGDMATLRADHASVMTSFDGHASALDDTSVPLDLRKHKGQ